MKLYIFQDNEEHEVVKKPPYTQLYETKSLLFKLNSQIYLSEPSLIIGDMKLDLVVENNDQNGVIYRSETGAHFINNVGLALIELIDESDEPFEPIGTINVLSGKITTERLHSMLEYICKMDSKLLHCCFSKTFLNSSGGQFEYTDLYHKLLSTEKTISFLWDNRHKFNNQPCKRVKTIEVVKRYSHKDLVDDRAYSWLLSHMDELEFTINPSDTLVNIYGKNLTARHIATSTIIDDKDIYENQVIYSFLIAVKRFIDSVDDEQNYCCSQHINNSEFIDVVPFIQNFVTEKFNIRSKLTARIQLLTDNCIKFITGNFTKTFIPNIRPRITQYVSRHNHYMTLYKLMDVWWNINASSVTEFESVHQLLFSIKSMDKLYELFVLLKMLEAFQSNKLTISQSKFVDFKTFPSLNTSDAINKNPYDIFNFYVLENDDTEVKIYLEPVIYPYRKEINSGELFIVDKYPDYQNRDAKKLYRAKHIRTPDYIIKIRNKKTDKGRIYILDAKYSKFETVLYKRLPTSNRINDRKPQSGLIDKYLHGIRIYDNESIRMVDGIFATYITGRPKNSRKVIQGISQAFGLWGTMPISPFVDLIEFSPKNENEINYAQLFIEKLLHFSLRK